MQVCVRLELSPGTFRNTNFYPSFKSTEILTPTTTYIVNASAVLCHAYVTQRTKDNDNNMRKCVKKNCNELFFLCISNNLYCNTIHLGWD